MLIFRKFFTYFFGLVVLISVPTKPTLLYNEIGLDQIEYLSNYKIPIKKVKKNNIIISYDNLSGTIYHPSLKQTDSFPLLTANMTLIDTNKLKTGDIRYVALSWDLLKIHKKGGNIRYNDIIVVESPYNEINGKWKVVDCMNPRFNNKIDFLFDPDKKLRRYSFKDIKITVLPKKK